MVSGKLLEHRLQGLVEPLHYSVSLWVIRTGADALDMKETVQLCEQLGHKVAALFQENFSGDPHS